MALMIAGGQLDEDQAAEPDEPVKPKIMGRLLEDDPAEKAAAAARHAAGRAAAKEKSRELPPLEFGHGKRDSKSRSKSSNGAHSGAHRPTPAEQAADGMDPIEDLISQIMEHEPSPHTRPRAEACAGCSTCKRYAGQAQAGGDFAERTAARARACLV